MGSLIESLRQRVEKFAGDGIWPLRIGGLLITFILIFISGLVGWLLERLAMPTSPLPQSFGAIVVVISMASTIASKSLRSSALSVLKELPQNLDNDQLQITRKKLSHIVGRDVSLLDKSEILRATAETVSENSVDGVFAPLFWMLVGASLWNISSSFPGPLAWALIYKASSTIDSMLGYKHGRMKWLGTAGAKLDDFLTWLPCRIVMVTLPLVSQPVNKLPALVRVALIEGSKDSSPNSGISEAIFAHCAGVRMGGRNRYKGVLVVKPILAKNKPSASIESINQLLELILKLEFAWLSTIGIIALSIGIHSSQ